MWSSVARYAVYILFPVLLAAIAFLGIANFEAAEKFGQWGERSIVESAFLIAQEKVDRVEKEIIATDNSALQLLSAADPDGACTRWRGGMIPELVRAAAVIDVNEDLVLLFHPGSGSADAAAWRRMFTKRILPRVNFFESIEELKHYHFVVDDTTYLVTAQTTPVDGQWYTAVLVYDTDRIVGDLFERLIEDVGPNHLINVLDGKGNVVFGSTMEGAGDFSVAKRFPSTLYLWKVQLAPVAASMFVQRRSRALWSTWLLAPAALGVVAVGVVILAMVWMRERRLNALKSEFIANTSHELKTPLALIRMFAELLSMGKVTDPEKVERYHRIILQETERLTALIDNVLDFSRIERGKSVFYFEWFDPVETARSALEVYRHHVESAGAQLVFSPADGVPQLYADKDAFSLVILNLVDNAVKYAAGTDVVGVDLYVRRNHLYLDVFDRGQGIPAEHLKRIFDRFYRYQPQDRHARRGSGIGLALVKHIARAHGGSVSVSSTPGVETRFSVCFPLRERE